MSVTYESQVHAECDSCLRYEAEQAIRLTEFKKKLRAKGWVIGKETLCPDCAKMDKRRESETE